MQCVIVNENGELYGGFSSEIGKPIWFKTKNKECLIDDEAMCDAAISQLKQLGYDKIVKRDANGILRKWVPTDHDASR